MARPLTLECLESKVVPAGGGPVTPLGISLSAFGVLHIKGDGHDDVGTVVIEDGQVRAIHQRWRPGPIEGGPPFLEPFQNKLFPLAQVKSISFSGGDGNDEFTNETSIKSIALGGDGDDELTGGSGADVLSGGTGDDTLEGRGGNDDLRGGAGSDFYMFVPAALSLGTDTIDEADGLDEDALDFSDFAGGVHIDLSRTVEQRVIVDQVTLKLLKSQGIENVYGTPGADSIVGNSRPNRFHGGFGNDTLTGAAGNDSLHGDSGDDTIYAGYGNNTVTDGAGNDVVDFTWNSKGVLYTTGGGNDTVTGSYYDDKITGSTGNDVFKGGYGNDALDGGAGNDKLEGGPGNNVLKDGPGNDTVDFTGNSAAVYFTSQGGNDTITGSAHNDVLTGSSGNNKLYGGAGNDKLRGLDGTDELYGQDGNDWLEAGSAAEVADGGNGTDYNAYRWAIDGTTASDVCQAGIGSCVFLSGLASAADQGMDLAGRITYLGNYVFNVKLYNLETEDVENRQVYFNGAIQSSNGKRIDPWQSHPEEFWTILYQRAYVLMSNTANLDFTDPDDAMYAVTGRSVDTGDWGDPNVVRSALLLGKVVTAGNADDTNRVYSHHSYSVLDVYQQSGIWFIKLRNPWGKDVNDSDIADGTHIAYGSNNDGIIIMSWNSFQGYHDFDRISIS